MMPDFLVDYKLKCFGSPDISTAASPRQYFIFLCSHHSISFPVCVLKYIFSITCYFRVSYTSFYSWSETVSRLSSSKC